jgi:hypothetical protein
MYNLSRRLFLQSAAFSSLAIAAKLSALPVPQVDTQDVGVIEQIDIYHLAHTDIGYTDQPVVAREMHRRYIDLALDACRRTASHPVGERFHWTTEANVPVLDWWDSASPQRRSEFLNAVHSGQIDVTALACNNTPYMSEEEWTKAVSWLPDDLWRKVHPRIAIQDDVNGFPRAGALKLIDRGITRLLTGINGDSADPFPAPHAFWWKLPTGRRMFVYLAQQYGEAYDLLGQSNWRIWDSANAGNTFARPPRPGELFPSDENSVRAAHRVCLQHLAKIETAGYKFSRLIASATNQWRWDNDPPLPALVDFIATWNRLELKPTLRLTTATLALLEFEQIYGGQLQVEEGEWTDWWSNGTAAIPRELAASRLAKRYLRAARSPAWGSYSLASRSTEDPILRDLVLFDEHTYDSADSILLPDSYETLGHQAQKALYAYRAMGEAQLLLASRMRSRLDDEPEGLYAGNPTSSPMTGWVNFPKRSVRREFHSLTAEGVPISIYLDKRSDRILPTQMPAPPDSTKSGDNPVVRFWVENLAPHSVRRYEFSDSESKEPAAPAERSRVEVDAQGWPKSAAWPGMEKPLFLSGFGDFLAIEGRATRNDLTHLLGHQADSHDAEQIRKNLAQVPAVSDSPVQTEENPFTIVYTQSLRHPRLKYFTRRLELWNGEPRARLTVRFYRTSSEDPENFYLNFQLPADEKLPTLSSGGTPFVPFHDQLGDTCRSFFAIDGWANYKTSDGEWLWVTRDAPLVTIGGPYELKRDTRDPGNTRIISALLFTNYWSTNFAADSHGAMEFQFDLIWRRKIEHPSTLAETLMTDPAVLINPATREDDLVLKDLWRQ